MKKMVLMVILSVLVYAQAFTQSKPIMGYDQVAWGATVAEVRRVYNIGSNVALTENYNNDGPNFAGLTQTNVSDSISQRIFLFNSWNSNEFRLYRVWVAYKEGSVSLQNLTSGLTSRFGDRTDLNRASGNCRHAPNARDSVETYIFGQYSPELLVELVHTKCQEHVLDMNTFSFYNYNYFQVCYTWKTYRDRYNARNIDF